MRIRPTSLFLSRPLMACLGWMLAGQLSAQTVTQVVNGDGATLFVKSDGSLWGLGNNYSGQLGLGSVIQETNVPQEIVSGGVGTVSFCDIGDFTLFQQGLSLWAMGDNQFGQLGDGTTNNHYVPEEVVTLHGTFMSHPYFSAIAAGGDHSLYGVANTEIVGYSMSATGWNYFGQLGDGTTNNHTSFETVLSQFAGGAISLISGGGDHTLFVLPNGSLYSMGNNWYGQLGIGSTEAYSASQNLVVSSGVIAISAGSSHSLFIKSDNSLWAFGDNYNGQLGNGTSGAGALTNSLPQQVLTGVIAVSAGYEHSLCIRSDGTLWGTGNNEWGELGSITTTQYDTWIPLGVSNVVAISAGADDTLFIKSDGSLWGMGHNDSGQLGSGNYYTGVPVEIVPPPQPVITSITAVGTNLVVTWPTNQGGFSLQSSSNLGPSAAWSVVSPAAVILNGQYTVTNPISAPQQFYRLSE